MASTADTMAHIIARFPDTLALPNVRLTWLVYLADWVHAIRYGEQVTPIEWYLDTYGPLVSDVLDTAYANPGRFRVNDATGFLSAVIALTREPNRKALSASEAEAADHAVDATADLDFDGLAQLVFSTHPILSSERFSPLDLVEKAREYAQGEPAST